MVIIATVKDGKKRTRTNKKVMSGPCLFPFKYKRETHKTCIKDDGELICATEINPKTGTMTRYGYCPTKPRTSIEKSTKKRAPHKSENKGSSGSKQSFLSTSPKTARRKRTKKVRLVVAPEYKEALSKKSVVTASPPGSLSKHNKSTTKQKTLKKRRNVPKRLIVKNPKFSKAERDRIMEELFGTPTPSEDELSNPNKSKKVQ